MSTNTRPTVQVELVRAADLKSRDVIHVAGRWREVYDVHTSDEDFVAHYGEDFLPTSTRVRLPREPHTLFDTGGPIKDGTRTVALGSLRAGLDHGMVVVRVTHIESSGEGTFDDRFLVVEPFELFQTQILTDA